MAKYGDLNKVEHLDALHTELRPYLLRRTKEEVESTIPPLQETIIDIEMTNMQKKVYVALYEKSRKSLVSGGNSAGISFTTSLNNLEMQLRKCCNHPYMIQEFADDVEKDNPDSETYLQKLIDASGKMILLDKLLKKMKTVGSKVLVFS